MARVVVLVSNVLAAWIAPQVFQSAGNVVVADVIAMVLMMGDARMWRENMDVGWLRMSRWAWVLLGCSA